MRRIPPVPTVAIPLRRALLCPNDDTVYDANGWMACPTCENEERIYLYRLLGLAAASPGRRVASSLTGTGRVPHGPWMKTPSPSLGISVGRTAFLAEKDY